MKHTLLLTLLFFLQHASIAQVNTPPLRCQVSGERHELSIMRKAKPIASSNREYIIPVVVHVFNPEKGMTPIDYDLIKDALEKTSDDFKGLSSDWSDGSIDQEFDHLKERLNIRFELAKATPWGTVTNGVIFYDEIKSGFANDIIYDQEIASYAWDNYSYLNIYIMNDIYGNGILTHSGVSFFPNKNMSDQKLSRVVYNGRYLGRNTDEEFRSVFTHELGHWLNLKHTFEGGCLDFNDDDGIKDTPKVKNNDIKHGRTLNCNNNYINWQNFMEYSSKYSMFTKEQVNEMKETLQLSTHKNLWSTENLIKTGIIEHSYLSTESPVIIKYHPETMMIKEALLHKIKIYGDNNFNSSINYHIKTFNSSSESHSIDFAISELDSKSIALEFQGQLSLLNNLPNTLEIEFENSSFEKDLKSENRTIPIYFLEELEIDNSLAIFPNPCEDFITIKNAKDKTCVLYNSQGKILSTTRIESNHRIIDLRPYKSGLYIIKVFGQNFNSIQRIQKI
ncbi:zinc-dependent metalloprotease [Aureibacter tunicatorum]|uniref:T9SS type A sorting domain-containing protein n=1 Tax=Aureibacter tunicatorum TaxID=866807 RepID=A0AAE3XJQ9_9BACT|nr:zinc-dependent metalloprotease [Aureibacter tunicatorum]MDR6237278.1 hypothetical protein [Aureibacter tunicatorum]BDD06269.1 hypothetical protein AUTU_37520 [Aureibacter tunicatorum]